MFAVNLVELLNVAAVKAGGVSATTGLSHPLDTPPSQWYASDASHAQGAVDSKCYVSLTRGLARTQWQYETWTLPSIRRTKVCAVLVEVFCRRASFELVV